MKVTDRDIRLIRDIALSHVLTGDQMIRLGYFGSPTRCNTRLRELIDHKFLKVIETPFFRGRLVAVGSRASGVVGERIAKLISARASSPRFLQHALSVTEVRLALTSPGCSWRFEQQLRQSFVAGGRHLEIRPDGMSVTGDQSTFIEVDLGNASESKLREKLRGYRCWSDLGHTSPHLAFFTTTHRRCLKIARLAKSCGVELYTVRTLAELGVGLVGGWS